MKDPIQKGIGQLFVGNSLDFQGKTYVTESAIGKQLFERVKDSYLDSLNLKVYTDVEVEETVEQRVLCISW